MPKRLRAPPQVSARLAWFKVADQPALSTFMTMVICANIALMGCVYHGQPESFRAFVDGASTVFTVIYAAEAAVKLIGLSPLGYPRKKKRWPTALSAKPSAQRIELPLARSSRIRRANMHARMHRHT